MSTWARRHQTVRLPGIDYVYSYDPRPSQQIRAPLLGINARWELGYGLLVTAHAGMARYRVTYGSSFYATTNGNRDEPLHSSDSESFNRLYAGIGLGYDVTNHVTVALSYDLYKTRSSYRVDMYQTVNVRTLGARVEYRF